MKKKQCLKLTKQGLCFGGCYVNKLAIFFSKFEANPTKTAYCTLDKINKVVVMHWSVKIVCFVKGLTKHYIQVFSDVSWDFRSICLRYPKV